MNSNVSNILSRKDFTKWALHLSLPIMLQNLIDTLVNSADTIMLGYVSQTAMSASSLANQFTFVLFCFFYGLSTGTSVLCAQYYGKGDKKTVERIIGMSLRITVIISVIFFLLGFLFPGTIMRIFTNSEATIAEGVKYLRISSFAFLFSGAAQVYISAIRSIGKVVFPSIDCLVSLFTNIFFNAAFIFGFGFFPKLGVVGVALGTVIARIIELLLCIIYSAYTKEARIRVKYLFAKAGILFKDFIVICLPAVGNDAIWALATSVFAVILGHIGDDIVAANAVAIMVVNIGAVALRGFASATTIVISQTLGRNEKEATKIYAKRMLLLTIFVGLIGCLIMILVRPFILKFYAGKLTSQALEYLGIMIFMTTYRLIGEGINTALICGCFRGGGDSKTGLILDTVFMWLVAIPLMAAAAYIFKFPPIWVYFVMTLDEYYKMPFVFIHYKKYKWLNNITRNETELSAK